MAPRLKELERKALTLSVADRAALAQRLISSLDADETVAVEEAWLEEAERRYEQYVAGRVTGRSADDAVRDARARLT